MRDWLYVDDHAKALVAVIEKGKIGETYNIGGNNEQTNMAVVHAICDVLEILVPNKPQESFESGLRKTVEWYLANPLWRQKQV